MSLRKLPPIPDDGPPDYEWFRAVADVIEALAQVGGAGFFGTVSLGPTGFIAEDHRPPFFLAVIDGTDGAGAYSWHRTVGTTGGVNTTDGYGTAGTTTSLPAYEATGATDIPTNALVLMWTAESNQEMRFVWSGYRFTVQEADGSPTTTTKLKVPNTSLTDNGDGTSTLNLADAAHAGLVSTVAQTFGGVKTADGWRVLNGPGNVTIKGSTRGLSNTAGLYQDGSSTSNWADGVLEVAGIYCGSAGGSCIIGSGISANGQIATSNGFEVNQAPNWTVTGPVGSPGGYGGWNIVGAGGFAWGWTTTSAPINTAWTFSQGIMTGITVDRGCLYYGGGMQSPVQGAGQQYPSVSYLPIGTAGQVLTVTDIGGGTLEPRWAGNAPTITVGSSVVSGGTNGDLLGISGGKVADVSTLDFGTW